MFGSYITMHTFIYYCISIQEGKSKVSEKVFIGLKTFYKNLDGVQILRLIISIHRSSTEGAIQAELFIGLFIKNIK